MRSDEEIATKWGKRPDTIVHSDEPFNAEPPRAALAGTSCTPITAFYVRNHGPAPDIDPARWRLRIEGLVERELELSLDDLSGRFEERELVATLQCAGNRRRGLLEVRDIPGEEPWGPGATGTASWRGVRLADVLAASGLGDRASHIAFEGADVAEEADPPQRFGASIPRHKAMANEVLLAWAMNGEPLPRVHGAPLRVVVPGYIGARSVKWLERIVALSEPSTNYFQTTSYRLLPPNAESSAIQAGAGVPLGAVAVNSDILVPDDGAEVSAGRLEVAGYAFAGDDRAIVRVDVSTDGGDSWRQADLLEPASAWSWRRWAGEIEVAPGRVEILARACDSAAAVQPEDAVHLWNPKGYVNNAWARVSVTAA